MWQCHPQYRLTALACGLALSAWPLWAAAPEDEQALALLKTKAEQFQRFLAQKPVFLSKEDFRTSPTGQLYYPVRLTFLAGCFAVVVGFAALVAGNLQYLGVTGRRKA
jgi:hypothetical protein